MLQMTNNFGVCIVKVLKRHCIENSLDEFSHLDLTICGVEELLKQCLPGGLVPLLAGAGVGPEQVLFRPPEEVVSLWAGDEEQLVLGLGSPQADRRQQVLVILQTP